MNSVPTTIASQPAVPVFDDLTDYWFDARRPHAGLHGRYQPGWTSVNVPKTGTKIRVQSESHGGRVVHVEVN